MSKVRLEVGGQQVLWKSNMLNEDNCFATFLGLLTHVVDEEYFRLVTTYDMKGQVVGIQLMVKEDVIDAGEKDISAPLDK